MSTKMKAKRRRGGWVIGSKKHYWLMKNILTNQLSVKAQMKKMQAACIFWLLCFCRALVAVSPLCFYGPNGASLCSSCMLDL
jgi:hypothetical protein